MATRNVDAEFIRALGDCTEALRHLVGVVLESVQALETVTHNTLIALYPPEPLQVTLEEAARMLSLDKKFVRQLVTRGELGATGTRRSLRIPLKSLKEYVNNDKLGRPLPSYNSGLLVGRRPFERSPFRCPKCKRGFRSQKALSGHMSSHKRDA
jgi:excisionase family DNA binding protein